MSSSEDVKLARKSLIRWIALSLGLIYQMKQALLLEILDALTFFHAKRNGNNRTNNCKAVKEKLKKIKVYRRQFITIF